MTLHSFASYCIVLYCLHLAIAFVAAAAGNLHISMDLQLKITQQEKSDKDKKRDANDAAE